MALARERRAAWILVLFGTGVTFLGMLLSNGPLSDLLGVKNLAANLGVVVGVDLAMAGLLLLLPDVLRLRFPGSRLLLRVAIKPRR